MKIYITNILTSNDIFVFALYIYIYIVLGKCGFNLFWTIFSTLVRVPIFKNVSSNIGFRMRTNSWNRLSLDNKAAKRIMNIHEHSCKHHAAWMHAGEKSMTHGWLSYPHMPRHFRISDIHHPIFKSNFSFSLSLFSSPVWSRYIELYKQTVHYIYIECQQNKNNNIMYTI